MSIDRLDLQVASSGTLTLDGQETGYWNAQDKTWVVDNSYAEAVATARRVAKKDGAPDLLLVPVPAPQEVRS